MSKLDEEVKLVFRIDRELHQAFKVRAAQEGISMQKLIVQWIAEYLK